MSSRKYNKLKRHPLIRFIRSILKLIRTVLRPKKRPSRSVRSVDRSTVDEQILFAPDRQSASKEVAIELAIPSKDPFVETVGELLDRVQWQIPPVIIPPVLEVVVARTSPAIYVQHSSTATVGELLGQVKWQIPAATGLAQSSEPRSIARTHDVSKN